MHSEESRVNKDESESTSIASQAAPVAFTPPSANANDSEKAGLSQSHSLIESRNLLIAGGQYYHTVDRHTNFIIHINQLEGSSADPQFKSSSPPLNETHDINPAHFSDQSSPSGSGTRMEVNHERNQSQVSSQTQPSSPPLNETQSISPVHFSNQRSHSENRTRIEVNHQRNRSQVSSQTQGISSQKCNDIYERHLTLKGRGFPLWIPESNRRLHLDYRRTGVRIGDVGIITQSGAFSFLFNICLPHNNPVNPRVPEHFAPISPPIAATDIDDFIPFTNGSHLASASVNKSQTSTANSDIVFESSASEGAILTMPRGARSEDLENYSAFREYAAANVANWYRFVNGPCGREAKNGDIRLVVGFDKTTSWGIATFANQTQQNGCRLKFGPSEGDSARTYTWSEYSGVADVKAGPDSDKIDELRIYGDRTDVQFENQCLFVRTLNPTLADNIWADIHSNSGSVPASVDSRNSQYPRVRNYTYSNHLNDPDNGSSFSPSQGTQTGTQRNLPGVDIMSDENPPIFFPDPVESIIANTAHPSKVLNDTLLAIPTAKMVITHDNDWSSVIQYDSLLYPHEFVANILASRDVYQKNGVVFLEPKKMINGISEGSTSVNPAQANDSESQSISTPVSVSAFGAHDPVPGNAEPTASYDNATLNQGVYCHHTLQWLADLADLTTHHPDPTNPSRLPSSSVPDLLGSAVGTWQKRGKRKNTVRNPRTEAYIEAMHKQKENFRKLNAEAYRYADYLESLLDKCHQDHHANVNFRAFRPSDPDVSLGLEEESDIAMGGEDNDQGSDDGNDPAVMAICIPPQSLQVEPFTQPSRFPALAENPDDTYVLLVDGVQSSHYNPTFDWSRHLPSSVPLDRPSHDKALDLLFKFFTSWCLRIVPTLFLRDMYRALCIPPSQMPPKTPHYSPMLHNALLSLALAFLDEPFKDLKTRQIYASTAKSFIEAECRKPNLSVVQALSVLASFHSSQGDQTLGYMYFGMSARMSQALGLHLDFPEWVKLGVMDESERLDRHWASWTTFTQARDVCWSLYVGRDLCVAEPIGAKATPMLHIDPELDKMAWFYPPAKIEPQPNNLTKTFEATCRLLMIARRIMDVINGLNKTRSRPLVLDALISDIDVRLNMWKSSLPEELEITSRSRLTATPHKLMLHLAYWWLSILLHRPFFHLKSRKIHSMDREAEIDHVKLCRHAAEHIMDLLSTWRSLYQLRYCPITLIQTAFSAGTVYLLTAMQASSGTRITREELRHSLDQETLVRQYLQEIGLSWNCATNISGTLRSLMNEQVRPLLDQLLDRMSIPTTAGLLISADVGDDEKENDSSHSRSSSRKRSSITKLTPQISSTHAAPSAPNAIQSLSSTSSSNSSSFTDSWALQPSLDPSPNFNYLPSSFSHPDFRKYAQPFSNFVDDSFSDNGNSSSASGDVEHAFGGLFSVLAHNFQPLSGLSSENHYVGGYFGMLGGQTISEAPFVGFFSEVDDTHSPNSSNFLPSPVWNWLPQL